MILATLRTLACKSLGLVLFVGLATGRAHDGEFDMDTGSNGKNPANFALVGEEPVPSSEARIKG